MEQFHYKDSVMRFFTSNFFRESVSLQPQSIPFTEIFAGQGAPLVSTTPVEILPPVSMTPVAKLPPVSLMPVANFATSFSSVVDTAGVNDSFCKFATSVNEYGGKLWDQFQAAET
jgi:hypothetical protein